MIAFYRGGRRRGNPIPIGIAHACQQVDTLPTQAWDVPLAKILVG